ncbi:MAG: DNA repair protein [Alphaproteobacteria bacterium 65-7]|nr:MAG: DNA repair protein [Alphaproteobacteria bacterium 65-7]
MVQPFFTVGHSNHSFEAFVGLLKAPRVQRVVDVRKMPMSRANPQFNKDTLPGALAGFQISYTHIAALGGLRGKTPGLPPDVNGFWENKSFRNYADYALSEPFREGLERLIEEGRERRCAIMCSEAVWWRCHRRLIADNLIARGETVFHIMGDNRIDAARLTSGAVVRPDKTVIYPKAMETGL